MMPIDHDTAWLDKLHEEFVEAFRSNDQKALGAYYTETAVLLPPGRPMISGRDAIVEFWQTSERIQDLVFEATDVKTLGSGAIREAGNLLVTSRGQGRELRNSASKYVAIWLQIDGAWRLDSSAWNGATPRRGGRRGNRRGGGDGAGAGAGGGRRGGRQGEGGGGRRGEGGGAGGKGPGGRRRAGGGGRRGGGGEAD